MCNPKTNSNFDKRLVELSKRLKTYDWGKRHFFRHFENNWRSCKITLQKYRSLPWTVHCPEIPLYTARSLLSPWQRQPAPLVAWTRYTFVYALFWAPKALSAPLSWCTQISHRRCWTHAVNTIYTRYIATFLTLILIAAYAILWISNFLYCNYYEWIIVSKRVLMIFYRL